MPIVARRHRGQPAPHRALRLLAGQGAPLDPGGQQGRHAAVRQCRARHHRDCRTAWRGASRCEHITDVRGTAFMVRDDAARPAKGWFEVDSTEVDRPGRIDDHINPYQTTSEAGGRSCEGRGRRCAKEDGCMVVRHLVRQRPLLAWLHVVAMPVSRKSRRHRDAAAREDRDPPAELRAGEERPRALRPRQPRAAPGNEPGQRARFGAKPHATTNGARRLAEPAADPAEHGRDGPRLRPALRAQLATRPTPMRAAATTARPRSRPGR